MKFGRKFKLTFELTDQINGVTKAIEITDPLTVEFDITRNTASTLNSATFKIYNLSQTNQSLIFRNKTSINNINGNKNRVIFEAGYSTPENTNSNLPKIFIGDLLEAYSYRDGANIITYISAQDGALSAYNSIISTTVAAGETQFNLVDYLINNMVGIKKGVIGETQGVAKTPSVLNGNVFYLLTQNYRDEVFIDLETINKLGVNEYIKSTGGQVQLLNSETGLFGTPMRQGTDLIVEMLFEPSINVGQLVEIQSQTNPLFNGQFKVNGVKHTGIISGAVNGECKTTLQLFIGNYLLGALKGIWNKELYPIY